MHYLLLGNGHRICVVNGHSLSAENLIPSRLLSMVIPYRHETLFLVAEQTTILSCPMVYPL